MAKKTSRPPAARHSPKSKRAPAKLYQQGQRIGARQGQVAPAVITASRTRSSVSMLPRLSPRDLNALATRIAGKMAARAGKVPPAPERDSRPFPLINSFGNHASGLRALPKPTPINLRAFTATPPCRRAINKVKDPISILPWKIQPKAGLFPRGTKIPELVQDRINGYTAAFEQPNRDEDWFIFSQRVLEDMLCGFGYFEIQPWNNPKQPFRLWSCDGASIQIIPDWRSDDEDSYRYIQSLAYSGMQLLNAQSKDFTDRELSCVMLNPRTHVPWGLGPVEVAFNMINAWLGTVSATELKESNEIPETAVWLGETYNYEKALEFREYWQDSIEGQGGVVIFGGGSKPEVMQLRRSVAAEHPVWPEFLLGMIALPFGLPRQAMNVERDPNRGQGEIGQSQEFVDAVLPVASAFQARLNRDVLEKNCGEHELEFRFKLTAADPLKEAQVIDIYVRNGMYDLDEGREMIDMEDKADGRGAITMIELAEKAKIEAMSAANPLDDSLDKQLTPGETPPGGSPAGEPPKGEQVPGEKAPSDTASTNTAET